jgi:parallel beta-helix repeat protein
VRLFENVKINYNIINNIGCLSAYISSATGGEIKRNIVTNGGMFNVPGQSTEEGTVGLMVMAATQVKIQYNEVSGIRCGQQLNDACGIDIDWSSYDCEVSYNTVFNNYGAGIETMSNSNNIISNNIIFGNGKGNTGSKESQIWLVDFNEDPRDPVQRVSNLIIRDNLIIIPDIVNHTGIRTSIIQNGKGSPWVNNVVQGNRFVKEGANGSFYQVINGSNLHHFIDNHYYGNTFSAAIHGTTYNNFASFKIAVGASAGEMFSTDVDTVPPFVPNNTPLPPVDFNAASHIGTSQGPIWHYRYRDNNGVGNLVYYAGDWYRAGDNIPSIEGSGAHLFIPHSVGLETMLVWKAPAKGLVTLNESLADCWNGAGTGVRIKIMKNNQKLFPKDADWFDVTKGIPATIPKISDIPVVVGDEIHFVITHNGATNTTWNNSVTFIENGVLQDTPLSPVDFNAANHIGTSQGPIWHYRYKDNNGVGNLVYYAGDWYRAGDGIPQIEGNGAHLFIPHTVGVEAILVWKAPAKGLVTINESIADCWNGAGTGVKVKIMKNNQKLFPKDADWLDVTKGIPAIIPEISDIPVAAGDEIHFVIAHNGATNTTWNNIVTFVENGIVNIGAMEKGGSIIVHWPLAIDEGSGVWGYRIYLDETANFNIDSSKMIGFVTDTYFSFKIPERNGIYYFAVIPVDNCGNIGCRIEYIITVSNGLDIGM